MRSHHKQSATAKHVWEAHSAYTADLGVPDRRRYRRTPKAIVAIEKARAIIEERRDPDVQTEPPGS